MEVLGREIFEYVSLDQGTLSRYQILQRLYPGLVVGKAHITKAFY